MASTIKLEFYDESMTAKSNCYGKFRGSKEDASTTTTLGTHTIPGGAVLCRVVAGSQRHYVNISSTAASTASNRSEVKASSVFDIEIPLASRTGSAKMSYRTCT